MSGIEFEDERVVDLGSVPYLAVDAEEEEEEEHQEVSTIDLCPSAYGVIVHALGRFNSNIPATDTQHVACASRPRRSDAALRRLSPARQRPPRQPTTCRFGIHCL